ncbi:hypothetical protein [Hymenobacter sp. BT188]|nr:hypothetical protein [Hymenobacter sp. BT188]
MVGDLRNHYANGFADVTAQTTGVGVGPVGELNRQRLDPLFGLGDTS